MHVEFILRNYCTFIKYNFKRYKIAFFKVL